MLGLYLLWFILIVISYPLKLSGYLLCDFQWKISP